MRISNKLSKVLAAALVIFQLSNLIPSAYARLNATGEKKLLMVSAYYSPLPAQRFYMRGSYEADKVLNGNGTNGADGTPVHIGMLAAPKTYAFGTQVRIPGLGVGVVHDRGGAIRVLKQYDRIDVWMGSGEDGLSRALNWGMRLVEGEVFAANAVEPAFDFEWVSATLPKATLDRLTARTMLNPAVFAKPITAASSTSDISDLQEALRMFGYYHGTVTGVLDSETREALKVFQVDEGVLPNVSAVGIGNFGPKTQQALKTKVENFNDTVLKEQNRLRGNVAELASGLGKKDSGDKVYKMQQMLWELGYYKGALNGRYDSATMDAVFAFQRDNGILQSEWDSGAGYYGKQTHTALVAAVDRRIEKLMTAPATMEVYIPAKVVLPSLNALSLNETSERRASLDFNLRFGAPTTAISAPSKPSEPTASVSSKRLKSDLSLGDKGDEVALLQKALITKGFLAKGLATGTFGEKTQKALVQFQLKQGIVKSVDQVGAGLVGPKTRSLINSIL